MGRLILFYVKMRIHFTCKIELFIHQPFNFLSSKLLVVWHRLIGNSTLFIPVTNNSRVHRPPKNLS